MDYKFPEDKVERLIEKAKALQKEGYNMAQLARTFGIEAQWFEDNLDAPRKLTKDEQKGMGESLRLSGKKSKVKGLW